MLSQHGQKETGRKITRGVGVEGRERRKRRKEREKVRRNKEVKEQ